MKKLFTRQNMLTLFLIIAFGVLIKFYPTKTLQPVSVKQISP